MPKPIYAIGDVHGQLEALEQALEWIEADGGPEADIVFVGDLVDRGLNSRAIIDRILNARETGLNWQVVLGNHDRMFLNFVRRGTLTDARIKSGLLWFDWRLGGTNTLASYGVEVDDGANAEIVLSHARANVPESHLAFLESLPLFLHQGSLLFVHAGIAPGVALSDQDPDDLVWIREPFLDYVDPHPWLVVHGHTRVERPEYRGNRVNLDGGAGYGSPIYPVVFEGVDCWLLDDNGRTSLRP